MNIYKNGSVKILASEYIISRGEIIQKTSGKTISVDWPEIQKAELTGDSDLPGFFDLLCLTTNRVGKLVIPFGLVSNYVDLLKDIISHLDRNCEIDPNLVGLAREGYKHEWKTFFRIEKKSALRLLTLFVLLLLGIWFLVGLLFNYWRWSL